MKPRNPSLRVRITTPTPLGLAVGDIIDLRLDERALASMTAEQRAVFTRPTPWDEDEKPTFTVNASLAEPPDGWALPTVEAGASEHCPGRAERAAPVEDADFAALARLVAARGSLSEQERFADRRLPAEELDALITRVLLAPVAAAGFNPTGYLAALEDDQHDLDCLCGPTKSKVRPVFELPEHVWARFKALRAALGAVREQTVDTVASDGRPEVAVTTQYWTRSCPECGAEHGLYEARVDLAWAGRRISVEYELVGVDG